MLNYPSRLPLITVNSAFKSSSLSAGINRFPISLAKSVWPDDKESFPWTISLADTSSWTYQGRQMNKLLDEMTTNISLVLNFKEEDGTASSACFHVDTSPLKINVFKEQLVLLTATIDRILSIPSFQSVRAGNSSGRKELQQLEICQKSGSTATAADLKEFLDMTHNSSGASEKTLKENTHPNKLQMSVWLQWTFSKVTLNCVVQNDANRSNVKLVIELEDIIYSLDMQEVYMQIKAKVGGMSGQCYEFDNEKASWVKNEALGLTVQTESGGSSKSANDTFLNLTITKAETTNVHTKWDAVKKNREQNESLVEIILKVEQIDLRLDLDLLEQCVDVLTIFQRKDEIQEPRNVLGVKDLPLILFNSKGLRLFIPLREYTEACSAYILKINSITMHHNVENPICRVPLRPDVYTKAAQMRILNVPGSKIEDRQYEFVLKEISLSTARWLDILAYIEEQTSTTKHHDNPAFEWNNLQEAQRSTDFEVSTIFKEFNFSVIYAPCIIYKNVLICSQAMELNCMSDLLMDLDLDQLHLAGKISRRVNRILQIMYPPDQQSCSSQGSFVEINSTLFASHASQEAVSIDSTTYTRDPEPPRFRRSHSKLSKCEEDSGVESYRASDAKRTVSSSRRSMEGSRQRKISERLLEQAKPVHGSSIDQQTIPYEICFLGGYFKVNLYEKKTAENVSRTLLRMVMAQPNGMLSLNLLERIVQVSLFDLVVELHDVPLLKTLPGEPDDLGIPQPLIKTRFVKSLTKMNNELSVDFKRPIKLAISHQRLKILLDLLSLLDSTLCGPKNEEHTNKRPPKLPKPILGRNKFKQMKANLYDVEKVNLRLSQIMIHLQDEDEKDYNCRLSFSSIDSSLQVQERPERISCTLNLEELVFCQRSFVIMHPFSFNATATLTQEYWKRDPLVHVKLSSSYLQLDFNPKNMAEMRAMSDHFQRILMTNSGKTGEECQMSERDVSTNLTPSREKLIPIAAPGFSRKDSRGSLEEHYQDDLRAGAFQFIESTRLNDLPLPYQIKITNSDVGTICWRYPQPRALYSVTVYPVPMNVSRSVTTLGTFKCLHKLWFE